MAEDLNSGRRRTNLASHQNGTWTWDCWIASLACWPLSHAASLRVLYNYFLSVEDGVPILPPSLHQRSILQVFEIKATQGVKKSKEGFDVTHGNQTLNLSHRRPPTNQLCKSFPLPKFTKEVKWTISHVSFQRMYWNRRMENVLYVWKTWI